MHTSSKQEHQEHEAIQKRMVSIARRMLESKRQLQQEIRDDLKNPEIQAAIDKLKQRNAERVRDRI